MAAPAALAAQAAAKAAAKAAARRAAQREALKAVRDPQEALRKLLWISLVLTGLALIVAMALIAAVVALMGGVGGGGPVSFPNGVPKVYQPMYKTAASHYKISPYLLASIHKQETNFSTAQSSRSGVNSDGCCGGPMQFNIRDGTWNGHKQAFRPIESSRPASYPLMRTKLPSCKKVADDTGCMYDDFDAIAAAAHKLSSQGATKDLTSAGTHDAVCGYIGDCAEVDKCRPKSKNRYCEVLPRAIEWEKRAKNKTPDIPVMVGATTSGSKAKLLKNGLAAAPDDAPPAVKRMIAAANKISDKPYRLTHFFTHINNRSYDCSSSTSHVLWAGDKKFGVIPRCSDWFTKYGDKDVGKWVTIYARGPCGGSSSTTGHVFMVIAGLRFDTSRNGEKPGSPNQGESGPRWREGRRDLSGFAVRHPKGL